MIKIKYKPDIDPNLGHLSKNILSYSAEITEYLPITIISWKFIFHLIKNKIKHKTIYFFVIENYDHTKQTFNWFYLNKFKTKFKNYE